MADKTFILRSPYRGQNLFGKLVLNRKDQQNGWLVEFYPKGETDPVLSGLIGDAPAFGDRGPAQAAAAFISFAGEPSAWDTEEEQEASREYGEDLYMAAEQHRALAKEMDR